MTQKFNRLTPIEYSHSSPKKGRIWIFQCDCGKKHKAPLSQVRREIVKSCGCLRRENHKKSVTKPDGVSALNNAYKNYKRSANKRNIKFIISKEEFDEIMKAPCLYCGDSPRKMYGSYIGTGIDRIDNNIGYISANCVACCTVCNQMKSKLTKVDFLSHILKIQKHFFKKAVKDLFYSEIYG